MVIHGEASTSINGEEYWFVEQFSKLTGKQRGSVRALINKGNSIRKLKTIRFGARPVILASELFDFPFVVNGRQPEGHICYDKFYLEEGELVTREESIEK